MYKQLMCLFSFSQWLAKLRGPIFAALIVTYFGFHVMNGERGIYAYFKETHRHAALNQQLDEVSADRQKLEHRVSHLRSDSLDLDLLDQQARDMLGLMQPGEKVILLNSHADDHG